MSKQIKHCAFFAIFLPLIFFGFCFSVHAEQTKKKAPLLRYSVVRTFPHDASHYTQGLIFHNGFLFESVGRYGVSGLFKKELRTGRTLQNRANLAHDFAEGLALVGDKLIQLTWREHTAYLFDLALHPLGQVHYDTEGWGLASLKNSMLVVLSDGSSKLRFLNAVDFKELRQVTVHDGALEIALLNELEEAEGLIYANVWLSNLIAVINPDDGHVVAWLDLTALRSSFAKPKGWDEREHVLNGIAYDPETKHFFVTGKCWPVMFELAIEREPIATQSLAGAATPQ